jgi:ATP adenylyltransferase
MASAKRIWAPWRMEYVLGHRASACIFCDFPVMRETWRKNLVLVVRPDAMVCLNRYPFAVSHLLVAPRRHVADLTELSKEEYAGLMGLVRDSIDRLRRATNAEGMNVGFNLGRAAGAGIADHVHGHLVPRWLGDTNFMPVLADVRVMPEYLDEAWRRLYPVFADLPGERAPAP